MTALTHEAAAESSRAAAKDSEDFFWASYFRRQFPRNTATCIAELTGTTVRAAEHVLSGRNSLSGRALANLLRSPLGPSVLDAIAGDVEWRAQERSLLAIHHLEQELEQKKRELERLFMPR